MKQLLINSFWILLLCSVSACKQQSNELTSSTRYKYENILKIDYTPDTASRCGGWFSDQGSWMGFTIPAHEKWINGFCGPFDFDNREWMAKSLVEVGFENPSIFVPDSTSYFPGELYLSATSPIGQISQRLIFVDKSTALLSCASNKNKPLRFYSAELSKEVSTLSIEQNSCIVSLKDGRILVVTFAPETKLKKTEQGGYQALSNTKGIANVVISFFQNEKELTAGLHKAVSIFSSPETFQAENNDRWNNYITKTLRTDMPEAYNRIAVKSIVTLISNWKSKKGGLLHDGVVPSHAVGYFMGFWAWDIWKTAAAMATFAPELSKDQIRSMFDYQQPDGMIIDCIYTDITENNARDSKPPLATWAVDEVFKATNDTAFVQEMYPQLLSYYRWWYTHRDHNHNGICEFGSVDGTIEAAAWESGMDNAIRFDDAKMVKNSNNAWSLDQESVDLNAFLALEYKLLKKLAPIAGVTFDEIEHTAEIASYFFDKKNGYFFDRRLNDGSFVNEIGSEGFIPFWTEIASSEQAKQALPLFTDSTKFATYIPCPTVAADNPKFMPKGYWRGPIWVDQTYFGISGLRNYGYKELADTYTCQVFDRLQGLITDGAIHENYGTHTGEQLKAPHFSWSSAHLLLLYEEYGKEN